MIIDALDQLIYKKISDEKPMVKSEDYKIAHRSSNGTIGFVSKKQKSTPSTEIYYLVNYIKRWYRLLWGTNSSTSRVKAHGEITLIINNPLRFIYKTDYSTFCVKDLQLILINEITSLLNHSYEQAYDTNSLLNLLNDKFENFGLEITNLDLRKGAS